MGIVIYTNSRYFVFREKFEVALEEKVRFSGNAYYFACMLNKLYFGGKLNVIVVEKTQLKGANGAYAPEGKALYISDEISGVNSIASMAVVAHEIGHAFQDFEHSKILEKNMRLSKIVKILGVFSIFFVIFSIFLAIFGYFIISIIFLALFLINIIVAITLKYSTIKVEKDASRRALKMLTENEWLTEAEIGKIKKILKAALKTYVADFLAALLSWTGLVHKTKFF